MACGSVKEFAIEKTWMYKFAEKCLDSVLERNRVKAVLKEYAVGVGQQRVREVQKLHRGGLSKRGVAAKLGVSRETVRSACKMCTLCSKEEKKEKGSIGLREFKKKGNEMLKKRVQNGKRRGRGVSVVHSVREERIEQGY